MDVPKSLRQEGLRLERCQTSRAPNDTQGAAMRLRRCEQTGSKGRTILDAVRWGAFLSTPLTHGRVGAKEACEVVRERARGLL